MTTTMGRFRYWGDQRPDTGRPLLTITRPSEAVAMSTRTSPGESATETSTGTLRIYGPIDSWGGWWGVSSKEVAQALDLLDGAERIVVRVNSPGGESSEGRAIMNLLRAHSAEIVTVVDGGAYSAASYIAMAGAERVMSPGATMMIHDTSTILYGNADAFRKSADVLDTLSDSGAELYAEIAGGTTEEWRDRQRAETWYTAATAVAAGLMQRVDVVQDTGLAETAGDDGPESVDAGAVEERARAAYDTSLFLRAPSELAPMPPNAAAVGSHNTEGGSAVALSNEQITMRQKLGIAEDADDATVLAALDEALEERADETAATATATTSIVPEGHVVIPAAKLADLEAGAAQARATATALHEKERKAFLDSVATKFLPTSRAGWEAEYDRDESGVRAHFAAAPVLIPTSEAGHAGEPEATSDDAAYLALFGDTTKEA